MRIFFIIKLMYDLGFISLLESNLYMREWAGLRRDGVMSGLCYVGSRMFQPKTVSAHGCFGTRMFWHRMFRHTPTYSGG